MSTRAGIVAWCAAVLVAAGCGAPDSSESALAQRRQSLVTAPDFVVAEVVAPASATPGQGFLAQVRVCNQGTASGGTDVELYLSADATIRPYDPSSPLPPEDTRVGVGYTQPLAPGQCETVYVPAYAEPPPPVPPATPQSVWHVGAVVDPAGSSFELEEGNNTLAGPQMGIGHDPDFVVTEVKSPASADYGQGFTAQVKVCNQGTSSGSTEVELYLSADATIRRNDPNSPQPPEDMLVGSGSVWQWLTPGQCETVYVQAYANTPPPPGGMPLSAWYVGAVVNPSGSSSELNPDNNTLAGPRMGVGSAPDFVVTEVKSPASADYGQSFTAQVRVCNQGTQGGSTEVELYLSADATIRRNEPGSPQPPEDMLVGSSPVWQWLAPGQCETVYVYAYATPPYTPPPPPGGMPLSAWYVGAVVNPSGSSYELDADNNTLAGPRMGVGSAPDFVVTEVTAPASADYGQSFIAQVRVCNQGTQSGSTEVELYLSADTTIRRSDWNSPQPPEDVLVGYGYPSNWLVPGQCEVVYVPASATPPYPPTPPPGGQPLSAWYVGAVVNPSGSSYELNLDNNTLAGPRLGVGNAPDFVVTQVTAPASVDHGQSFTAQARVCNQGTQSGSTDVELYLSADTTIRRYEWNSPQPPEDAPVGHGSTQQLVPGQCEVVYVPASATPPYPPTPPPGGQPLSAWYVGAVVNPSGSSPELNPDNNTLAGPRLGVGNAPDFVVTQVTAPASVDHGQSFTAQARVCNQGTQSGSTDVELYLSADTTIRRSDWSSPQPPEDAPVGYGYTQPLVPGQCETLYLSASANLPPQPPPPPGGMPLSTWYVGAVVNPSGYSPELNPDNNTLAGTRMGVGSAPDFIVSSVTAPASADYGQSFIAQVQVCNQGTQGGSTDLELYLSSDATIRRYEWNSPLPPEDAQVGSGYTSWLVPGQCEMVYVPAYANPPPPPPPPAGAPQYTWYVGAVVNPSGSSYELNADNNALAGPRLGVGSSPDFIVASVTAPASAEYGQSFLAQARVCNQGTQSGSTEVELYLSADTTIRRYDPGSPLPPEDAPVGSGYTSWLVPGQCEVVYVPAHAYPPQYSPPPPGGSPLSTWYVGAVVNPTAMSSELNLDNNTLAGPRMGVGRAPDFVVTQVTAPASADYGQSFIAQVRVCNQGMESGSTDVELYLSADATIRRFDPNSPPPPEDAPVGYGHTQSLVPGQCELLYVPASANPPQYSPPPPGGMPLSTWYVGAVVNPGGYSAELNLDNNTLAGPRMGVGRAPDFVVTQVTGPASAEHGQGFIAQVQVCNQGTESGSTDLELYLSADTTLRRHEWNSPQPPEDAQVGYGYTSWLVPGQCEVVYVPASANPPYTPPPPPGGMPLSTWYVGALVNPTAAVSELNLDNNTLAGTRMGVGRAPDFVVTQVTAPASADHGQSFIAQVQVCNQGMESGSTDVELYLSADATIRRYEWNSPLPPEDAPVGSMYTQPLAPGQCETVYVPASANPPYTPPPPGGMPLSAWYVGALVNPTAMSSELNLDNNTLAGTRMGVGRAPDFVVTQVTAPASAEYGQSLLAQVQVCNQGTQSGSTDLELYLSADATIRRYDWSSPLPPEDALVGFGYTQPLAPGQCELLYVPANAYPPQYSPPPSGGMPLSTWYVGAVVNPSGSSSELNLDNNALAGTRMGVGRAPDFVVTQVMGPASADYGQSFTAQVQVCNQGTESGSTDLELYLSADATIRRYDPGSPLPPEDAQVGSGYTSSLMPGQCQVLYVPATANPPPQPPLPPGAVPQSAWYLGAVVRSSSGSLELNPDNNTLAGTRMGIGNGPDFIITSVTGPASAASSQSFTAQVEVCNQGTQSGSTDVELYLSADATIRPYVPGSPLPLEDAPVGFASSGTLQPGQCQVLQVSASANPPPPPPEVTPSGPLSAWYVGAVADPAGSSPELNEGNNTLAGSRMGIGHKADFILTSVTGPASATQGQAFTAQATVCNQGTESGSTDVELYLSADATIRRYDPSSPLPPEDSPLGSASTDQLAPGQCQVLQVSVNATPPLLPPPPAGMPLSAWYLGAVVNPMGSSFELDHDNNTLAGTRMGIGRGPDFIITSVTGPTSATQGQSFTAQATVCNQGTESGSADVELYLSADGTIRPYDPSSPLPPEDARVGSAYTDGLMPGQCQTVPVPASANPLPPPPSAPGTLPGGWVLGAAVNSSRSTFELNNDNNTLAGARMGVGSSPDFLITSVTGPTSAQLGQSISVSARVCNYGRVSGSTNVELYLSADTTVTKGGEDFLLGTVSSGTLGPGACATKSATVPASVPSQGAWYLAAMADPTNTQLELIESNNALAGNRIGLGSGADFIINSVSVPTNAVRPGQAFSTSVSVCNRGTAAGSTEVALYLSPDTTIAVPTPSAPAEDLLVGSFTTVTLNAGACASQSVSVTANVPREGTWYLGAIADPTNTRPELIEDNNARASSRLGVGHLADFTFTSVSGPTTATQGQPYTASFTVCNRGTVADSVDVQLYFSADSTISPPAPWPSSDLPQGVLSVGLLNPATCTTRSFTFNISVPSAGSWYLGVAADPDRSRTELFEDNNTRAGTRVTVAL